MSVSQAIAAELPQLRRFARALTGNQESGDAYVVATLQAVIADPSLAPGVTETNSSVYRLFLTVWNSLDVNRKPLAPSDDPALSSVQSENGPLGSPSKDPQSPPLSPVAKAHRVHGFEAK